MTKDFTAEACERALAAKSDYLGQLPGDLYRISRDDIDTVWEKIESPLEQVALLQLAGANYAYEGPPRYAKVAASRGLHSLYHYPVQIIPQVSFGPYRVDFLVEMPAKLLAVECDGKDFHTDAARDKARDEHLYKHYGVRVLRLKGKDIWRNDKAVQQAVQIVQVWLM